MKTKIYFDRRSRTADGFPLKLYLKHKSSNIYISLGIRLEEDQWDAENNMIVRHSKAGILNKILQRKWAEADGAVMDLVLSGLIKKLNPADLRSILMEAVGKEVEEKKEEPKAVFKARWDAYAATRGAEGYRTFYTRTWKLMEKFDPEVNTCDFGHIDKEWLKRFDAWLAPDHTRNGRAILYRCIRAVFNDALDDDVTTNYPFRKFKFRTEETRHRNLSVEELRSLINAPATGGNYRHEREYIDLFTLSFLLIGINLADMKDMEIVNGRVEYRRAKTHKLYDIKLEPEAEEIIKKYSGGEHVINIFDRFADHNQLTRQVNRALRNVGNKVDARGKVLEKGPFGEISYYWARHTWASIASELDIPEDVIAKALGHGKKTVTDVYINFDMKKVDEANRRVIDWVYYGKDWRQSSWGSMRTL